MSQREASDFTDPFGPELQVMLGVTAEEYEALRRRPGGVTVSKDPGWHSHPVLGIRGHLHPGATTLHSHRSEVVWTDPIPLDNAAAEEVDRG